MIPDNDPGQGMYMTLNQIRDILINDYGRDSGDRMSVAEVDQICATLRDGFAVKLLGARLALVPEGGPGLYCCYLYVPKEDSSDE